MRRVGLISVLFLALFATFFAVHSDVTAKDGSEIGMGDCANEQGMCISQCEFIGSCIANCAAEHDRCVFAVHSDVAAKDGAEIGLCMGDCANEQGMCISQCEFIGSCIANCATAHGRCVARCH